MLVWRLWCVGAQGGYQTTASFSRSVLPKSDENESSFEGASLLVRRLMPTRSSKLSIKYVGSLGPMHMDIVKNTTKEPAVAWMTVKNKTRANFWKNVMTVKSMMVADAMVVKAAAKIDGPIWINAYLVLSSLVVSPGNDE